MTAEDFERGVRDALEDSHAIVQGRWVVETKAMVTASTARGYGELASDSRSESSEPHNVDDALEIEDDEDDDFAVRVRQRGHAREYRVVYSTTFRVPVLCVRARDATTRASWSASRLLQSLRRENPAVAVDDRDPVLTPYANPHEPGGGDWACVHPCATAEVMKLLLRDAHLPLTPRAYVDAWLRYVAREVALRLNNHARPSRSRVRAKDVVQ